MTGACHACATPLAADARFCSGCGVDVTDPGATVSIRLNDPTAELQDRLTRTLAGRYQVQRLLGAGGMAAVFLADEIGLDRQVAIKVLPPELSRDEGLVTRFQREAKTSAKLDHPHIIPIHRVESEAGLHYFVMKYVPGSSLETLLARESAIPVDVAIRILCEAAAALGHAHSRDVVHRDVKPANIMLDQDGRVVLTDFGIAKAGEASSLTQTGTLVGTPYYMAPEQALGLAVDGRADQYALGIVAYQIFARQCPFTEGSAHTIIYRHIHEAPTPLGELCADVPRHVVDAIAIALAKDPSARFATMEEFAAALRGDADIAARPASGSSAAVGVRTTARNAVTVRMGEPRAAGPQRGRRLGLGVAAGLATLTALAGGWMATGGRTEGIGRADSASQATQQAAALPPERTPATPPRDSSGGAAIAPAAAETSVTSVAALRSRPSQPEVERPVRKQTSPLTVASEPYGVLFIDDVEIGDTPIANHPLEVGQSYNIRIEREGYRSKRETIRVGSPNPIRRSYVLDPGAAP